MQKTDEARKIGAGKAGALGPRRWWLRGSLLLALVAVVLGSAHKGGAEPSRELHWSPDGQHLAASMWWPLKSGVWLFGPDGSPLRKVTDEEDWVQWVEDDRLLTGQIVLSGDESWSLIDLRGKRLEVIHPEVTVENRRQVTTGAWRTSPDGRYLVYTTVSSSEDKSHYAVVLYRFSDHHTVRFPIRWWGGDDKVVWSPDSHYAYSAEMSGDHLWRVDAVTEILEEKTRPSGRYAVDMAANSAGQLVLLEGTVIKDAEAGKPSGGGSLALFDWATGSLRPISKRPIDNLAFGRDPTLFVGFEEGNNMICIGTQEGRDWRVTRLGRSTSTVVFALSPDSTRLAYAPDAGGVKVVDLAPFEQVAAPRPSHPHGVPGAAVFVRLSGAGDRARSDVYEQQLGGGPARVLISHATLPKSFRGHIERALPSPDGAVMLLEESDGGYWLWSRRTATVRRVSLVGAQERLLDLRHTGLDWPMEWSPRGKLLLMHVYTEVKRPTETRLSESLRVLDGATGRTRTIHTIPADGMLFTGWAGDGTGVFVGERAGDRGSRLEVVTLSGQVRRLLTVPSDAFEAALSPDGRQLATADSSGYISLFRREGDRQEFSRVARMTMGLLEDSEEFMGDMVFSGNSLALATRVSCSYGVAHDAFWERLWIAQTETGTATRVAPDIAYEEDGRHVLLGWVPGQSELLLMSQGSVGVEGDYHNLWLQPVSPSRPLLLLAGTGPGGIDMAWWGGPPTPTDRRQRAQ